ncbi:MAG: hypothetical protein AB7S56_08310, partial [Halothiobacillaceae bacterium]
HLLGMEARQQWEETEASRAKLMAHVDEAKEASGEALDKLADAAQALKNDLIERYKRLTKDV